MDLSSEHTTRRGRLGQVVRLPIVTALWMLSLGCDVGPDGLPTGPSELTAGITVYVDANGLGLSAHLTNDIAYLSGVGDGPEDCNELPTATSSYYRTWDDCISSVHLAPGWSATLYEDPNFKGASLELTEDAQNLQLFKGPCDHDDWNDCVSSIRVRRR